MKYLPQLRSRVSRRIFLAILLCALIPIGSLIALTMQNVRSTMEADTAKRLHHAGKNIGMALVSEFVSTDKTLRQIASFQTTSTTDRISGSHQSALDDEGILEKVWLLPVNSTSKRGLPKLTDTIKARLKKGLPQLIVERENQQVNIFLWSPATDASGQPIIAVALINPDRLEEYALNFLPINTQLSILDGSFESLLRNPLGPKNKSELLPDKNRTGHQYMEVEKGGETWLVGHWSLFLQAAFNSPEWHILVSEPKQTALASLFRFGRNAGLTGIVAFWVTLLTSSILIRKTLQPLQQLKEATKEISLGHFDGQVQLQSRDEFEELSVSFNQMTSKIQQQISQQKKMSLAVRQILGANEVENIISNFFNSLTALTTVETISLTLYDSSSTELLPCWRKSPNTGAIEYLSKTPVFSSEIDQVIQAQDQHLTVTEKDYPTLLKTLAQHGDNAFSLISTEYKPSKWAIISLAHKTDLDEDAILASKQLIDQLGVALSRAEMVNELDALNLGILTALARTVDANSPWTLGHSERVTEYALDIAKVMGLSEAECQDLNQAGLLHDLGKISVPSDILNKPAHLTDEEYGIVKNHPTEGARIIEPISVFDNIRPIVKQHHERWDGKGYPDQLKGTNIHLGARILAVADVYDALYSERPYRKGWDQEKVLNYLQKEAGKSFDPEVVAALCKAVPRNEALPVSVS